MFRRPIIWLLLAAFIFRIFLMVWSFAHAVNKDVLRYRDWAMIPYMYKLTDPYEGKHITFGIHPLNMPPGTLYVLTGMYRVNILVAKVIYKVTHTPPGSILWVNTALTNAFLRLPNLLADLLTGYLIYALVKTYRKQTYGLCAASLYLFNPSIFYNSSYWGQMDAVNTALFFLGVYLLVQKKKTLGIFSLFLSLFVKLTLIYIIGPLIVVAFLRDKEKIIFVLSVLLSIVIILFFTLPISPSPITWFITFLHTNGLGEMHNITSLAFNVWWVLFKPKITIGQPTTDFNFTLDTFSGSPESSEIMVGLSLFTWALILFALVSIPIGMKTKHIFLKSEGIFLFLAMISLLGYLFLPHMHERYLFPFFPLMATFIGLTGKYIWEYIGLSFLNFINLYFVWHSMIHPALPYLFMNSVNVQWTLSLLTVLVGLFLYIRTLLATCRYR
jgi:hypothetical protein